MGVGGMGVCESFILRDEIVMVRGVSTWCICFASKDMYEGGGGMYSQSQRRIIFTSVILVSSKCLVLTLIWARYHTYYRILMKVKRRSTILNYFD